VFLEALKITWIFPICSRLNFVDSPTYRLVIKGCDVLALPVDLQLSDVGSAVMTGWIEVLTLLPHSGMINVGDD